MPPLIELDDLQVRLPAQDDAATPGVPAWVQPVRGISLQLAPGDTLGVIGESGSGKSLLALAMMGLLPEGAQLQGQLRIAGQDMTQAPDAIWRRVRGRQIAMVFQEPMTALNPLQPVGLQVAEPLRLHEGLPRRAALDRARELLERVGIPQAAQRLGAYPHQFSGGQRQRIVIAMAIACRPALLIADEPTTALDATVQRQILDLLAELVAAERMALLLISHDLGVVARTTQRLAVMYAGQFVEHGPTGAVFTTPAHPYTRGLLAARPRLAPVTAGAMPERLAGMPGQAPDARTLTTLTGCAFAPRCGWAVPACTQAAPAEQPAGNDAAHRVRCIRLATIRSLADGARP